ncbi:hypothetical protein ACFFX1_29360 [Dactylosporangium sucinum]|uniref:Uncharacterized protein n=1 Tax=Dactylosporangium sucinum TaxID=1424081 RepID=A0A917U447_9ACTN|nr:hypothetical protein [Dactylosporangium sucinum]GGM56518.1 hypothetical protein GCM10007977_067860 [Dactylosporangium sucinum]
MRLGRALAWFVPAYLIVTVLASASTLIYAGVNDTAAADEAASSMVTAPSFTATVPYHVLIMLLVFTPAAYLYFRRPRGGNQTRETLLLALCWLAAAMVVDFVGFVVIQNPWSMPAREFYVDYQPWISLIYLAIFASPWLRLAAVRARPARLAA